MTDDEKLQLIISNIIRKITTQILKIENTIDPYSTSEEGFEPDIEKDTELLTLKNVLKLIELEIKNVNNLYSYDEENIE